MSSKLEDLQHKKRVTSDVAEEAKRRNEEIKEQLKLNENYRQISHLEEKLSDLIEETKDSTAALDQLHKVQTILSNFYLENIHFDSLYLQEVDNDDVVNDAKKKLTKLYELMKENEKKTR